MSEGRSEARAQGKRRRSARQRQDPPAAARIARRRMMADVPTADVIVTNPTHFAVALQVRRRDARAERRREGRRIWSPRASARSRPSTTCRCSKRRRSRARSITTRDRSARFRGRSTAPWRRCSRGSTSCARFKDEGGDVPAAPRDLDVPAELDRRHDSDEERRPRSRRSVERRPITERRA